MSYKIVVDSPCDFTEGMKSWKNIAGVPLTLEVDGYKVMDDENLDKLDFIRRMAAYDGAAKSACPSIDAWLSAYDGDETDIYVVTITGKLSGTYNSAMQASKLFEEERGMKKNIHVFDSKGTSGSETLAAMKIKEIADTGASFEDVVSVVENYIQNCEIYFCLDDLDNMRKNGRLSNLQASVLNALRVKLICKGTDGEVDKISQDISMNRAVIKMCGIIEKSLNGIDVKDCALVVSHCQNEERGKSVLQRLTSMLPFGKSYLLEMSGLNTLYANVGGIVVAFSKIK